ncbi:unnamed protein product [Ceutorhynchus assimilis]|uniref:Pupal cuticle protein Edg-78E n=1 Tax=Ceutorhynchus assimilis TaxID=467358 RepID=A0A9N9MX52_9CUCU|nr:unnamed protein product [Ceutorhynchus assimilis]
MLITLSRAAPYYSVIKPDGSYEYAYQTDNGIYAEQKGNVLAVEGSYLYQSPEGIPIHLTYTADENGFHPSGDHLPTPPPIPIEILRAIEWIKKQNEQKENKLMDKYS